MEDKFKKLLSSIGVLYDEQSEDSNIITCVNHYAGNSGYHHLKYDDMELVLLKGIYKDFVRILKGENPFTDRQLTKVSEILSNIEKNCDSYFCCQLINNTDFTVKTITELKEIHKKNIPLKIKRPLSAVEYNIFKDILAEQENLYSSEILGISPEITHSVLLCSILKKIPEVMSIIFAHSGFRVFSPSIKVIFNKIFPNYNTMHMAFNTISNEELLKFFFSQPRFVKQKKSKFKTPKLKLLNLSLKEAQEFINEFEQKIPNIDEKTIFDDSFYETISLPFISFQMVLLLFMENFSKLNSITSDYETTLKMIYQTRPSSPFYKDDEIKIIRFTEEEWEFLDINPNLGENIKTLKEIMQSVPPIKRFVNKTKIEKLVKASHEILDMRDRLYFQITAFMKTLTGVFKNISQKLVVYQKLKHNNQLYYLEIDEVKNLLNDSYYGNTQFTYFFKKWQLERFKAQLVPSEIFEKDIGDLEIIIRKMISTLLDKKTFPVLSFFHKETVTCKFTQSIPKHEEFTCVRSDFYENFILFKNKTKTITTNVSPFSWLMEMATISEVQIYSGVRFSEIIFRNKTLKCHKNKIDIE